MTGVAEYPDRWEFELPAGDTLMFDKSNGTDDPQAFALWSYVEGETTDRLVVSWTGKLTSGEDDFYSHRDKFDSEWCVPLAVDADEVAQLVAAAVHGVFHAHARRIWEKHNAPADKIND